MPISLNYSSRLFRVYILTLMKYLRFSSLNSAILPISETEFSPSSQVERGEDLFPDMHNPITYEEPPVYPRSSFLKIPSDLHYSYSQHMNHSSHAKSV